LRYRSIGKPGILKNEVTEMKQAKSIIILLSVTLLFFASCGGEEGTALTELQQEAQDYLDSYTATMQDLYSTAAEAEWASNTRIVAGDDSNALATREANEKMAAFTGSEENINAARSFLERRDELLPLQVKQLEAILYEAANNPATVPELVKERIAAETEANEQLYGYSFILDGEELSTNEIDRILADETNVEKRLEVWALSKEVGQVLREDLKDLQRLRNETVRALGYDDYFTYQVSDYGMTTDEMMALNRQLVRDIWPLYREIHTWARYTLAEKYGQPVPEMLPAHWLPNRWGQGWEALVQVEGFNLDTALAEKSPEWLVEQAERFYVSLGFPELPETFWVKSSLYPAPEGADYKKNNHASAWHMDLENDVRSLMSVENNTRWYETTHHELGHIYYYLSYTNPNVPPLLRGGANRAYHEGIGSLMGLAAMQPRFAAAIGLVEEGTAPDTVQTLLAEAMNYVVFMPWGSGVMTEFEHDLYAEDLPDAAWNARWWELKKKYQGIVPPAERGEEYCDPATKTHIINDAAQYYDYALSNAILFQLHLHIAKEILGEDPHDTNYYGREDVGQFLRSILEPGASVDWRELMQETVGEDLNARAMLTYFQPLYEWLKEQNAGRVHTLPETLE
jgi:peptidyl-dipeptidase A